MSRDIVTESSPNHRCYQGFGELVRYRGDIRDDGKLSSWLFMALPTYPHVCACDRNPLAVSYLNPQPYLEALLTWQVGLVSWVMGDFKRVFLGGTT